MWAESAGPGPRQHLPLHDPRAARPRCRRARGATSSASSRALKGKRILVVDDNATNRRILALQTAKWGMVVQRHRVARAGAAAAAAHEPFDLAILDMHMPAWTARRWPRASARPATRCRWCCSARSGRRGSDRQRCSPPRWPSRCARASCSTRWSRCSAHDAAAQAAPQRRPSRSIDATLAAAPPAAHPAGRGQRGEPEAGAAAAAADGLPRRPGQQRHRGHRVRRSASPTTWC